MNQQVFAWMPPAALRGPLRGAFCYRRAYFITSSLASWQVSVKQILFGTIFFKLYRTIKEFQIAPRDQCKFKLYRVVNVKVHCTAWSEFLHRAKKGTPFQILHCMLQFGILHATIGFYCPLGSVLVSFITTQPHILLDDAMSELDLEHPDRKGAATTLLMGINETNFRLSILDPNY